MKAWLLRKVLRRYQEHFIYEILGCLDNHRYSDWSDEKLRGYSQGIYAAVETLKGEK